MATQQRLLEKPCRSQHITRDKRSMAPALVWDGGSLSGEMKLLR
jgi:hypothetical protein